jgi:Raf kinase inhibitor-like YbhB/YbcL family protein
MFERFPPAGLLVIAFLFVFSLPVYGQSGSSAAFTITTNAFQPGAEIPDRYTCSGSDISPQLGWNNVPGSTKVLALIADDPDAPSGLFTHWVLYNLSPETKTLQEGLPKTAELPGGAMQGVNSAQSVGYHGPCPPPGKPHRYFFRLYALDSRLDLKSGASRSELEQAMKGHIAGRTEIMGRYRR